ncbi:MAG: hypothetical protein OEU50_04060 [Gammaproteobacteria bacterium]|nr:hypothetical protein [Gammaproteobacteria bacterium]
MAQKQQREQDDFTSAERRKRTWRIVVAHVLIVATFFIATFFWGKF